MWSIEVSVCLLVAGAATAWIAVTVSRNKSPAEPARRQQHSLTGVDARVCELPPPPPSDQPGSQVAPSSVSRLVRAVKWLKEKKAGN